ncbi:DDH domain-containing protein [Entamoeba marina]
MRRSSDELCKLDPLNLPIKKRLSNKWTVVSHGDGDGICSAVLALSSKKLTKSDLIISHPMGLNHDIKNVQNNLFISDIALDARTYKIYEDFPLGVDAIVDEKCCASELVHRYFSEKNQLPHSVDIFACIGSICDYYDNTPYILDLMNKFEKRSLFFDAGIMAQGLSAYRKKEMKEALVLEMVNGHIPCEIPDMVDQAILVTKNDKVARTIVINNCCGSEHIAWCYNPPCGKSKAAHYVSAELNKSVGLSIFYYIRRKQNVEALYDLCFRGTNSVDLREIITPLAIALGGSAGGHFNAVGSRIPVSLLGVLLFYIDKRITEFNKTNNYSLLSLPNLDHLPSYDASIYDKLVDLKTITP